MHSPDTGCRYDVVDAETAVTMLRTAAHDGTVTSTIGSFTTGWGLDQAAAFVRSAPAVALTPDGGLAVRRDDGRVVRFDVHVPAAAAA